MKDQRRWGIVSKVMGKKGEPIKSHVMIYKALVHVVLMHNNEIWAVTDSIMTVLESLHHRIARRIMGITMKRGDDR